MSNVLVTVTNTGWIHKCTIEALLKISQEKSHNVEIRLPTENPYENNLNHIVKDFIDGNFDYWLQIDSDNAPIRNPLELISLDKDVMLMPYLQWHCTNEDIELGNYPIVCLIMDDVGDGFKEHKNMSGLQEVDAGGSGCMLIARKVLQKLQFPFTRTFDRYGRVEIGVDFNFCRRARDLGFKIWCHYDYPVTHFKQLELREVKAAFESYFLRKTAKSNTSGRDLTFYYGISREKWSGDTHLKRGVAGAHEGTLYLAPELSKLGWNVTVYTHCDKEKKIDGVTWIPFQLWNRFDMQDVTIACRIPGLFRRFVNSKVRIADLHDVGDPMQLNAISNNVDKIFVKSNFHRSLYPEVLDDKFSVIPYGVDISAIEYIKQMNNIERDPYLIVNTAAPDRSLGTLIKLFLEVKKRVPEAKLAWAYGWSLFDDLYSNNERMMKWKQTVIETMELHGIVNLDRITHEEVTKLYLKARVYAYPTHFPETFCISVLKAQICGAIPVTTDYGALNETVQQGFKIHTEEPGEMKWGWDFDYGIDDRIVQQEWIDCVVRILENPISSKEFIDTTKFEHYDWKVVAKLWDKELTQLLSNIQN